MKAKRVVVFIWMITLLVPITAFGNSTPIYLEEYPSFSIAPMKDCPIKVDKENLTFKIDEDASDEAMVTAEYTLTNTSKENITVPMVFPYVSDGYDSLGAKIIFNGKDVPYQIYSAGHVNVRDYLKKPDDFSKQVNINSIIENLNKPLYTVKNFDPASNATLYKITFNTPTERQCKVGFTINPDKTRVLAVNFSGFEINENGNCTVFEYVNKMDVGKTGFILVLGEDTLNNIRCDNDKIEKTRINIKEFIMKNIIEGEDNWYHDSHRKEEDFYWQFIKEIDRCFEDTQFVFSSYMIIENMMLKNNISALLYEVEFKGNSKNVLTISYPMRGTIDREKSNDYVNTFAYILNPAKNFKAFGKIHIQIELNNKDPYIIKSSIPLNEVNAGIYDVSLENLPDEDFVFSTYVKKEIDFLDRTTAQILPRGYARVFFGFFVSIILLLAIGIGLIIKWKRKNK